MFSLDLGAERKLRSWEGSGDQQCQAGRLAREPPHAKRGGQKLSMRKLNKLRTCPNSKVLSSDSQFLTRGFQIQSMINGQPVDTYRLSADNPLVSMGYPR